MGRPSAPRPDHLGIANRVETTVKLEDAFSSADTYQD